MTAELGDRIRAARTAQGLSLRATAAQAEISPSLLSQVETGKVQPSVSTLYAIVSCLGLSLDEVLGNHPPEEAAPAADGP
ncbi:MAG: XRE family transcriptional regulator [Microbacterium sp.]|nr:MAG: XRE family transcriptional regulator [Microbacterium sp.]